MAATTDTAAAATRPTFLGLNQGVSFSPNLGSGDIGETTRVDNDVSDLVVVARGAVKYPDTAKTDVSFGGFDPNAPSSVDVALFEFDRGSITGSSPQVVNFAAKFEYSSRSDVDDFFVDMVGDTLIK